MRRIQNLCFLDQFSIRDSYLFCYYVLQIHPGIFAFETTTEWQEFIREKIEEEPFRIIDNGDGCQVTYRAIRAAMNGEMFDMSLVGEEEISAVVEAVNMGIDSRLEACYVPDRGDSYVPGERSIEATSDGPGWEEGDKLVLAQTMECTVSPESMPVLLRRLFEIDSSEGHSLASSILTVLEFDPNGFID